MRIRSPILGNAGKLDWTKGLRAIVMLSIATATALYAQTFTTLHSFAGYPTDGANPVAGLVQVTNGDLYGTTDGGGTNGGGTVFKITPSGALTALSPFCTQSGCAHGEAPYAGLIQAANGDLYGTTTQLGANNAGTIFKITLGGALTTVYSFCSQSECTDGEGTLAGLVQATNGDFYGTTEFTVYGRGTVFKITPGGALTTLYTFCLQDVFPDCSDGYYPVAALVQATNGDLYGTTAGGGANGTNCPEMTCGTVFKITPAGALTTLYSFCSQSDCADGGYPQAVLVQATNGDLYRTTSLGGVNCAPYGCGTVFKITPGGTLTTLYSFCSQSNCTDGAGPVAGLIQATDGNLYGTTSGGGANGGGTVFKITPGGTLTTLYSFCSQSNCTDGAGPVAGLVQATNGDFCGTTSGGGADGYGTVFSLAVGLGPFVETQTTSGAVGAGVNILGSDLTGTTSVTFNGTAATFTVVSRYLITTTVPAGATTGKVHVVTPSRTLSSNVAFRVQ